MKKRYDHGFIHILAYLFILTIFAFTLYACLDILELIEVPEEYSVSKWLSEHTNEVAIENVEASDDGIVQNIVKKVRVEIENTAEPSVNNVAMPEINSYQSNVSHYQTNRKNATFLYYDQLDDYAKVIYTELEKNLDNMKSGTYNVQFGKTFNDLLHEEDGETILNNSFQLAINALNFDNPELFYIDISKVYLLTKISTKLWITTYEVEIGASQGQSYLNQSFQSPDEINRAIAAIENEKARIKNGLSGTIENQMRGVHDYLVDNLEYDSTISKDNIYNLYGALINRTTVCEGYARAFKAIMDDLNIPCLIACGIGINSTGETESHAWNYVMLDGKWYAIDVTWDDPIIIGNGRVGSDIKYRHYLKGSNEFFVNHKEDGAIVGDANFKYPTLSMENYE